MLQVGTQSAKILVLGVASLFSPPQSFPVVKSCRFPCNSSDVRLEWDTQEATNKARDLDVPPGSLFPTGETVGSGETS